jgi:hypothetical protein
MTSADELTAYNLLAIEGPSGARLASGYETPFSGTAWIETASLPLGPGPHALATRVRMRPQ